MNYAETALKQKENVLSFRDEIVDSFSYNVKKKSKKKKSEELTIWSVHCSSLVFYMIST